MKKIFFILSLMIISFSYCYADMVVSFDKLPNNIKSFVKTYFPSTVVMFAEQDYNEYKIRLYNISLTMEYLKLNNGVEIEFDINGAWKEVKSFQNFPTELLPKMIVNSIIKTYPNVNIIKVERIWNGYEIKLSNMMELFIDKNGNIVASQFDD